MEQKIGDIKNSKINNVNNFVATDNNVNSYNINIGTKEKATIAIAFVFSCTAIVFSATNLCQGHPRHLQFDYLGAIIGVLALLITVLIGWNIYQLVDFGRKTEKIKVVKENFDRGNNYIHNKTDYNQAIVYAMMSQSASVHFASSQEKIIKFQMLHKGIIALKIFSNFPDCGKEISALTDTIIEGMNSSVDILLEEDEKTDLIMLCGGIANKEMVPKLELIIDFIKKS